MGRQYDNLTVNCRFVGVEETTESLPLVCFLGGTGENEVSSVLSSLETPPFVLACVSVDDWASSFSPWPYEASRRIGGPFQGKGPETLRTLRENVLPDLASSFPINPVGGENLVIGYSLSGLFALWAMYECNNFGRCASCSGSLWYPGWIDYAKSHHPPKGSRIYLSLGKREEQSGNKVFRGVGAATRAMAEILRNDPNVARSVYVEKEGGHSYRVSERLRDAILWQYL